MLDADPFRVESSLTEFMMMAILLDGRQRRGEARRGEAGQGRARGDAGDKRQRVSAVPHRGLSTLRMRRGLLAPTLLRSILLLRWVLLRSTAATTLRHADYILAMLEGLSEVADVA
jgi:hypothetical protein